MAKTPAALLEGAENALTNLLGQNVGDESGNITSTQQNSDNENEPTNSVNQSDTDLNRKSHNSKHKPPLRTIDSQHLKSSDDFARQILEELK